MKIAGSNKDQHKGLEKFFQNMPKTTISFSPEKKWTPLISVNFSSREGGRLNRLDFGAPKTNLLQCLRYSHEILAHDILRAETVGTDFWIFVLMMFIWYPHGYHIMRYELELGICCARNDDCFENRAERWEFIYKPFAGLAAGKPRGSERVCGCKHAESA